LRWNDLSKKGGQMLSSALKDNKALLYIELNGTDIGNQDLQIIEDIME